MKIAFIGDSFCADANRNFNAFNKKRKPKWLSWLELVALNYNAEIICAGKPGTALFHAYEDLIEVLNEADYIVLCITKEFRLANRYRMGITPTTATRLDHPDRFNVFAPNDGKRLNAAAASYYAELMSTDFHSTIHYLLIKEIDNLLHEYNKKCIWFFAGFFQLFAGHNWQQECWFNDKPKHLRDESDIDYFSRNGTWKEQIDSPDAKEGDHSKYLVGKSYKIKSGPVCDTPLSALSDYDLMAHGAPAVWNGTLDNMFKKLGLKEEGIRLNHLGEQNNIHMSKLLIDTIDDDDFTPRKIKASDYFNGLAAVPQWVIL